VEHVIQYLGNLERVYLTGDFDEPDGMRWPLWDADCLQCHPRFEPKGRGFDGEAFHDRPGHNEGLGVDCVECHDVTSVLAGTPAVPGADDLATSVRDRAAPRSAAAGQRLRPPVRRKAPRSVP